MLSTAYRRWPYLAVGATISLAASASDWTHLSGDAARGGVAHGAPHVLSDKNWVATPAVDEEFSWLSSPVVSGGRVILTARRFVDNLHTHNRVIAFDAASGDRLWGRLISPDLLDSWSTPVVIAQLGQIVVGSGDSLYSLDAATGEIVWETGLDAPVVNASPVAGLGLLRNGMPVERVMISDFAPRAVGRLYGVNISPFDSTENPFEAGEIVWRADIPRAGGNSPAYAQGVVIVADGDGGVHAFDAIDGGQLWMTSAASDGFFGGVTIRDGFVFAATYDFAGSGNNSELVKLDVADGRLIWSTPCERTDSIPIVGDSGRIYLSAGISGFGSAVKVQAFEDFGGSAALVWDTHTDTAGALTVGGWTHHPVYAEGLLYAGVPDRSAPFGPYAELFVLDVSLTPDQNGFVVSRAAGTGGSPAVADGVLYSVGVDGLSAFSACDACDMNCDGRVDALDIESFLGLLFAGDTPCGPCTGDVNGDGFVDALDIEPFLRCLFP